MNRDPDDEVDEGEGVAVDSGDSGESGELDVDVLSTLVLDEVATGTASMSSSSSLSISCASSR